MGQEGRQRKKVIPLPDHESSGDNFRARHTLTPNAPLMRVSPKGMLPHIDLLSGSARHGIERDR
jgi:hypothetical protein